MPTNKPRKTASARPTAVEERRNSTAASSGRTSNGAVRLSDPAARRDIDALVREVTSSPDNARAFLREAGFLTPGGRVPRRFGGR